MTCPPETWYLLSVGFENGLFHTMEKFLHVHTVLDAQYKSNQSHTSRSRSPEIGLTFLELHFQIHFSRLFCEVTAKIPFPVNHSISVVNHTENSLFIYLYWHLQLKPAQA